LNRPLQMLTEIQLKKLRKAADLATLLAYPDAKVAEVPSTDAAGESTVPTCAPFIYKNEHFTKTGSGQT
jgi:hypothetical protein